MFGLHSQSGMEWSVCKRLYKNHVCKHYHLLGGYLGTLIDLLAKRGPKLTQDNIKAPSHSNWHNSIGEAKIVSLQNCCYDDLCILVLKISVKQYFH